MLSKTAGLISSSRSARTTPRKVQFGDIAGDAGPHDQLDGREQIQQRALNIEDGVTSANALSVAILSDATNSGLGGSSTAAPGVRSYSAGASSSYFSIDDGATVVSYFSQTGGADYADWLSNPIPNGFGPQVQDAFGEPGTNPVLGPSEITAFNAIGYQLVPTATPEPSTVVLAGLSLALGFCVIRRKQRA